MRIAVADENNKKFLGDLITHWEEQGHEVRFEPGASEKLFEWADIYYVEWWTNNIHYLYNWHKKHPKAKKPKLFVRAIDWDVWSIDVRSQEMVDWVNGIITIAPHIHEKLLKNTDAATDKPMKWGNKLHLAPLGVDTDKYKLIKRKEKGYNVLIPCNEIDWVLKNTMEGIKIMGDVNKAYPGPWKIFVKGKWTGQAGGDYFKRVVSDYCEKANLDIEIVEQHVPDYNEFIEKMDYCLVPSLKEAFSYVVAECASKGIKPVINNWYGAEKIWNKKWLYTTFTEAKEMFFGVTTPETYRRWMVKNKNLKDMLSRYDKILGL